MELIQCRKQQQQQLRDNHHHRQQQQQQAETTASSSNYEIGTTPAVLQHADSDAISLTSTGTDTEEMGKLGSNTSAVDTTVSNLQPGVPEQDVLSKVQNEYASTWWSSDPKLAPLVQQLLQSPATVAVSSVTAGGSIQASSSSNSRAVRPPAHIVLRSQTQQLYCNLLQQELALQCHMLSKGVEAVAAATAREGDAQNSSTFTAAATAAAGGGARAAAIAAEGVGPEVLHARWVNELMERPLNERFQQLEREALTLKLKQRRTANMVAGSM